MITVRQVSKRYGATVALDDVSLEVTPGTTHVLLGSSGSGKSTLLRVILGLVEPDAGEALVDGVAVTPAARRHLVGRVGYVVQEGGLYPHLTAARQREPAGRGGSGGRARGSPSACGSWPSWSASTRRCWRRYPAELSGGQRQRVGLMRALVLDPPLLLLDEPLGALDPIVRADLQAELRRLFGALGKTVVLVTHDVREAVLLGADHHAPARGPRRAAGDVRRSRAPAGRAVRDRVPERPGAAARAAGVLLAMARVAGRRWPRRWCSRVARAGPAPRDGAVRVGSKSFTESYVLAEIAAQAIEAAGEARGRAAASGWAAPASRTARSRTAASTSIPSTRARSPARSSRIRRSTRWRRSGRGCGRAGSPSASRSASTTPTRWRCAADVAQRLGLARISDLARHPGADARPSPPASWSATTAGPGCAATTGSTLAERPHDRARARLPGAGRAAPWT